MKVLIKFFLLAIFFLFIPLLSLKTVSAYNSNCPGQSGIYCNTGTRSPGPDGQCYVCASNGWQVTGDSSCSVNPGDCGSEGGDEGSGTGGITAPNIRPQLPPLPKCDPKTSNEICNPVGISGDPTTVTSRIINALVDIVFIVGGLIFIFLIFLGAISYMTSGGDKAGTQAARGKITAALIGISILLLSFLLINLVQNFLGVSILKFEIPHP